jgi:hypothetical protein
MIKWTPCTINLTKKLDILIKQTQTTHSNTKNTNTPPSLINLTNITFTREHIHTLALVPNYALAKDPKDYINEPITDIKNANRQLDPKIQNTFRHMASIKIKQIMTTSRHHTLHKRYQYNLNQIKSNQWKNNLTIPRDDKNKAIVIINKDVLEQKTMAFIQENHITHLNKDSTDLLKKQIQQALQKCGTLVEKSKHKYLIIIRPTPPCLNAYIKTHKQGEPIWPVINKIQAPSYRTAKFLNKKLQSLINLPKTYTTKNSHEVAQELHNIQINENHRIITLDIKDLYLNLPIQNILHITKFWLNKHNCDRTTTEQTLYLLETILKQNYFQYNNRYYQTNKGIAMGSPISSTLAEIYLQYLEEMYVKHCLENKEITYSKDTWMTF